VNQPPCTKSPKSSTQQTPSRKSPEIQAIFQLLDETDVLVAKNWYEIKLTTKGAPADTKHIEYQIFDETSAVKKLTVGRRQGDFEEWIEANGDVFIIAQGASKGHTWHTQATLFEALRRGYGENPPA